MVKYGQGAKTTFTLTLKRTAHNEKLNKKGGAGKNLSR